MGRSSACDDRCWYAEGSKCTCFCGGRFHAKGSRASLEIARAYGLDPADTTKGVLNPRVQPMQMGLFAPRSRTSFESIASFCRERGLM